MNKKDILYKLNQTLPGKIAQYKMAPSDRHKKEQQSNGIYHDSAVAVICYRNNDNWNILLSKRQSGLSHHSNQVSFIGGQYDETDTSLLQTAIRETKEETGVSLNEKEMVCQLTPLIIPTSGFKVFPFVFLLKQKPQWKVNSDEIERLLHISLDNLLALKRQEIQTDNNLIIPYFIIDNETVWGATAMILNEFIELLR
jgi:8-oxo-dGTP pyrophosphatase MutT (NUDIX family)